MLSSLLLPSKALRAKVNDLEEQLRIAVEEIMGSIETGTVLKQAAHARALEEHPEWKGVIGVGYSEPQRRDLIYKHLQKLLDLTRSVTRGDATKAKQLIDLLHARVHAGEARKQDAMTKTREKNARLNKGIMLSLSDFVHRLHDAGGKGRYPDKIRQAMQVHAAAADWLSAAHRLPISAQERLPTVHPSPESAWAGGSAACLRPEKGTLHMYPQQVVATSVSQAAMHAGVPVKDVANAIGLNPRLVSQCKERFDALCNDGDWEQLFDDRGAVRSDELPEEWVEFALLYWTDEDLGFVRRSEKMSAAIRDPKDRKAPKQRLFTLEARIGDMYEAMKAAGKERFGADFHFGLTKFRELRPFFVKDATRETCMCIYHLRWTQYCDALLKYRHTCRQMGVSTCQCSFDGLNEKFLRQSFVCQKDTGTQKYDNVKCVTNQCEDCHNCKRLTHATCGLCDDELRDPGSTAGKAIGIRYEKYTKIEYLDRHGAVKVKKDFRTTESVPISEFVKEVQGYWPKLIAHHNDAKWLDEDWLAMKKQLPRGSCVAVMDFAENYAHEPRYEHQSKYFSQTQTTILPVVLRFRIEDMTVDDASFTAERKAELLKFYEEKELPPVIVETHYIISNDMQHDNAFVQKALDDFIAPYIQCLAPSVTNLYVRSDGCKAQFKCAEAFDWTSRQSKEGCGLKVAWSFFESCHGKCDCDPEGGVLKNAARNQEMRSREHALPTTEAFYEWAKSSSGLHTPQKALEEKDGRGIFRRFFHFIPAKGPGSVDRARRKKFDSAKGSSQLHEFVDIGVPGTVSTRRAACHQCAACWGGERRACANKEYVGPPTEMTIKSAAVPLTSLSRNLRTHLDSDAIKRAETAAVGSVICIETARHEKQIPWVLGKVLSLSKPADGNMLAEEVRARTAQETVVQLDAAREADMALCVQLYEPIDMGSSTYTLSPVEVLIPARRVRVVDVGLSEVPRVAQTAAAFRSRRQGTAELPVATPTTKYKLPAEGRTETGGQKTNGLLEIRAEMPTMDDSWDVEAVVQYRTYYRKEQWLIKWKGYGEDRNTWEPKENLLQEWVLKQAEEVKKAAVAHHERTGRWV